MAYNAANSQNSPLDEMGVTVAEQSANVSLAPDVAFTSLAIGFAIAATEVSPYGQPALPMFQQNIPYS